MPPLCRPVPVTTTEAVGKYAVSRVSTEMNAYLAAWPHVAEARSTYTHRDGSTDWPNQPRNRLPDHRLDPGARPVQNGCWNLCGDIGALRTLLITCVMSPFMKIVLICVAVRLHRLWLHCATWRSLLFIGKVLPRLLPPDATLPLILIVLFVYSFPADLPSNNSQALRFSLTIGVFLHLHSV
jgi:hypothetical protein